MSKFEKLVRKGPFLTVVDFLFKPLVKSLLTETSRNKHQSVNPLLWYKKYEFHYFRRKSKLISPIGKYNEVINAYEGL